jgi:hypothetical protein
VQPHVRALPARPDPTANGAVLPAELLTVETPTQDVTLTTSGGIS